MPRAFPRKRIRDDGAEVNTNYVQGRSGLSRRKKRRMGRRLSRAPVSSRYIVQRWQRTSDSFLGPGMLRLGCYYGDLTNIVMPMCFMSLTNIAALGDTHAGKGCNADVGLCRVYKTATGSYYWWPELCQNPDDTVLQTNWQREQSELNTVTQNNARKVYHDWTDIRLNLYGTFSVPITYNVYVMQFKTEIDPMRLPRGASFDAVQGTELYNFYKDITRNLMGNSVNFNGRQEWPKDCRILRHDRIKLDPLSYSDQVANESDLSTLQMPTHTPNVHEYRLFMRHGRYRDHKWCENADDTVENENFSTIQWDVSTPEDTMCDVEWGKRLYLVITATCPELDTNISGSGQADRVTARTQGSFDINVRNKHRFVF